MFNYLILKLQNCIDNENQYYRFVVVIVVSVELWYT